MSELSQINMSLKSKKILYAVSTLTGTIVGVGIFGLPYVASKTGFIPMFFYLCAGAIIVLAVHLIYLEVIMASEGNRRLPGYVMSCFGKKWGAAAFINFLFGMFGSLLVYIIVGGEFLKGLLSPIFPISLFWSSVIFFATGAILIYKDMKSIEKAEFSMLIFLIAIVMLFFFISFDKINILNFYGYDMHNIFMPYGIVLFSFWGTSILPEIKEIFQPGNKKISQADKNNLRSVNIISIGISFFVYLIFVITVLGVAGKATSMEAFSGLTAVFSKKILYLGYLFGFLTVFTSFLTSGLAVKNCICLDYNIGEKPAFLFSMLIPLILFFLKFNNFINIINFIGTITFGIAGLFIFSLYLKIKSGSKKEKFIISNFTACAMIILFLTGIFLSLRN